VTNYSRVRDYDTNDTMIDGGSIRVRAIHREDRARLLEHFQSLSPESVYFRFFGLKKTLSEEELSRLSDIDYHDQVALIATLKDGDDERIIGVGRYFAAPASLGQPRTAEIAFAVLDAYQGHGIGTILLKHLSAIARVQGITEFKADVLGGNRKMIEVFESSGFSIRATFDSGAIHLSFTL
jgi:RimJ/RimL family protein N-acetyltransferase